jgi:hypothetical protein
MTRPKTIATMWLIVMLLLIAVTVIGLAIGGYF